MPLKIKVKIKKNCTGASKKCWYGKFKSELAEKNYSR